MSTTSTSPPPSASSRSCEAAGDDRELGEVVIDASGNIAFVHSDELVELLAPAFPLLTVTRASHVEPAPGGGWEVDVAPLAGPSGPDGRHVIAAAPRRDEALALERAWVINHLRS